MKHPLNIAVGIILLISNCFSLQPAWANSQSAQSGQLNDLILVQFSEAAYSTLEETETVAITITLSAPATVPITVTVTTVGGSAAIGTDFMPLTTPLQIASGTSDYQVAIQIIDDSQVENAETFSITLSDPINASLGNPASAQVTINDSDGFRNSGITFPGSLYAASAWADFDNDGDLDILAGGNFSTKFYRNDGSGIFSEFPAGFPNWRLNFAEAGDYDNDGDLDVVASGWTQSGENTGAIELFNNDGNGFFNPTGIMLEPEFAYDADWGDYDNDGDLDLVTVGHNWTGPSMTKLYRNDGSGIFFDTGAALEPIGLGSAAWADYDNDGFLDLLLTGSRVIGSTLTGGVTFIFHNNGDGGLVKAATLAKLAEGSIAWGDYDGDGDLDVLVNGYTASYAYPPSANKLYRNDQGVFVLVNPGLPDGTGHNAWGDYDNDGDFDLLLTGIANTLPTARVIRNDAGVFVDIVTGVSGKMLGSGNGWGDYDNNGCLDILVTDESSLTIFQNKSLRHNTPPSPPGNLSFTWLSPTEVLLQWSPGSDAQTPSQLLTYDLRIGTFPGGRNVASPPANLATGTRLITAPGYLGPGTTAILRGLDPRWTYYWSVQTVDSAYAGSAFTAEGSFTLPSSIIYLPVIRH